MRDSAWWIVAQSALSQTCQILAIDRADGMVWANRRTILIRQFAKDLSTLINDKNIIETDREVAFLAFASSNLSLHLLLRDQRIVQRTRVLC